MTTLADLTEEQRAECVGMWATNHNYTGDGEDIGVIACVQHDCVWLIHTCLHGEWSAFSVDSVSPLPALPRAWNPDGTPQKGRWHDGSAYQCIPEYAIITDEDEGSETQVDGDHWHDHVTTCEANQHERWGDSRRWVGEWEPTE